MTIFNHLTLLRSNYAAERMAQVPWAWILWAKVFMTLEKNKQIEISRNAIWLGYTRRHGVNTVVVAEVETLY